jgi:hypothetical protein
MLARKRDRKLAVQYVCQWDRTHNYFSVGPRAQPRPTGLPPNLTRQGARHRSARRALHYHGRNSRGQRILLQAEITHYVHNHSHNLSWLLAAIY